MHEPKRPVRHAVADILTPGNRDTEWAELRRKRDALLRGDWQDAATLERVDRIVSDGLAGWPAY